MKKVCHISGTTLPGGGPEHIYQFLKRLNRNDWEIVVCTSQDGSYWEKFNSLGIKTYNLALRKLSLYTPFKLFSILRKEKPDAVISTGAGVAVPFIWVAKLLGIRTAYLECITRIHTVSTAGKMILPVVDIFFGQWEELVGKHKKIVYRGRNV